MAVAGVTQVTVVLFFPYRCNLHAGMLHNELTVIGSRVRSLDDSCREFARLAEQATTQGRLYQGAFAYRLRSS